MWIECISSHAPTTALCILLNFCFPSRAVATCSLTQWQEGKKKNKRITRRVYKSNLCARNKLQQERDKASGIVSSHAKLSPQTCLREGKQTNILLPSFPSSLGINPILHFFSLSLSLSLSHARASAHTHTNSRRERKKVIQSKCWKLLECFLPAGVTRKGSQIKCSNSA